MRLLPTILAAPAILAGLALAGAAAADPLLGTWSIVGEVFGNDVETICTFGGSPPAVTATCTADNRTAPATRATVDGDKVTWDWDAGRAVLTFKGTLTSDAAMKGVIRVSFATGSFTAKKQ